MEKRQLLINSTMSFVQVVVIGSVLFILYRFLLKTIGVEKIGIWSVVMASVSASSVANLGLTASVVKFVAKYVARHEDEIASSVIQTTIISIGIILGCVLLAAYPFAEWFMRFILPLENLQEGMSIFPYALLSFWIVVVASVFQAGLDGCQRIDLRSIVLMAGAVLQLILNFLLVPTYGLRGLAYTQVIQSCFVLMGSWVLLKQTLPLLPLVPHQWDQKLFREMLGYGLNFQVISVSQMLFQPITKVLLAKFGGLALTGFYEMASRMVLQLRALLVSVNRVLVPTIAGLVETNPTGIPKIYKDSYCLILYMALPFFSLIIAIAPLISEVWIGHYEHTFVVFFIFLAVGWFFNTLSTPAYIANLGTGELIWNTIGHILIVVLNLGLGLWFGRLYGGLGIVIAFVVALIVGSSAIPLAYHIRYRIPLKFFVPEESRVTAIACLVATVFTLLVYNQLERTLHPLEVGSLSFLVFVFIVMVPVGTHPMRKGLTRWVMRDLFQAKSQHGP